MVYTGPRKGPFTLGGKKSGEEYCVNRTPTIAVHPSDVKPFEKSGKFKLVW